VKQDKISLSIGPYTNIYKAISSKHSLDIRNHEGLPNRRPSPGRRFGRFRPAGKSIVFLLELVVTITIRFTMTDPFQS
jgi:hypothetical protein